MSVDAEHLGMTELTWYDELSSWTFFTEGPSGPSQITLTVQATELTPKVGWEKDFWPKLWEDTVAHATSSSVRVTNCYRTHWASGAAGFQQMEQIPSGSVGDGVADPFDAACVMQLTGHADPAGARRLTLPGTPRSWSSGGLMTDHGMRELEGWCQFMLMGMGGHTEPSPMLWWLAYPGRFPPGPNNPLGVGLRRIEYLAVLQHTRRMAPPTFGSIY